jgi:hypothetical protein
LTIKKTWLSIAGGALIPLAAVGATNLHGTIVQNGAPISIDRCVIALKNIAGVSTNNSLSEDVSFTNVSQRTATQVRFAFEIVDASGLTERILAGDKLGSFAPGSATSDSNELPTHRNDMTQTVSGLPSMANVRCSVRMVRFDDGSIWHEGDGPAGNAVIFTPLPGPTASPQWQWPYDQPTP